MKTTRILLFFLAVFMAQGVMADNEYLAVWKKSGEVVYYDLSEEPVTTYADGNLKITTSSMSVTYPLEEVLKYTYTDTPTDIVQAKAPSVKVKQLEPDVAVPTYEVPPLLKSPHSMLYFE